MGDQEASFPLRGSHRLPGPSWRREGEVAGAAGPSRPIARAGLARVPAQPCLAGTRSCGSRWPPSSLITAGYSAFIAGCRPAAPGVPATRPRHRRPGIRADADDRDALHPEEASEERALGEGVEWLRFHIFTGLVGSYMVPPSSGDEIPGHRRRPESIDGHRGRQRRCRPLHLHACPADGRGRGDGAGRRRQAPVPAGRSGFAGGARGAARKGLATWRAVHVPLTFVLFIVAFVHIVGAVYYATLLR